jgi:hypothetical protein
VAGGNRVLQNVIAQITAEPDIAPDDMANLRGLQYLRAMIWAASPTIGANLTVGGVVVPTLTAAQIARYNALVASRNYAGLFALAQNILNAAGVFVY